MMACTLSVFLLLIFAILSGFDFYWRMGGVWGLKSLIPKKENDYWFVLVKLIRNKETG
ncbi:MAG: hypothetical protein ACI8Q1_000718 [Parvicella sp.]|jgi:hypothetical protein